MYYCDRENVPRNKSWSWKEKIKESRKVEPEYREESQKQGTVGTYYYWASKKSINIRITIE